MPARPIGISHPDDEDAPLFEEDPRSLEPPPEVVEKLGDAMKTDVREDNIADINAEEEGGEDGTSGSAEPKKKQRWVDSRLQDLARGVPLNTLMEDSFKIRGQNFVCLSFVFGDHYHTLHCGDRVYRGDLIKVRGVFKTRENAAWFIQNRLLKEDPHSHVFLAQMFQWTTLEEDAEDDETPEDRISVIDGALRGYFENENERLLGMQRRIDIVRAPNKKRAKETGDFFFEAVEQRLEEEKWKEENRKFFKQNKDKEMGLDEVKKALESGKVPDEPPLIRLQEDENKVPNQNWCCLSYITPKEFRSRHYPNENLKRPIVKIRGVFATREEAEQHIRQRILHVDPKVDVSLVPCGKWTGLEDDSVEDREYMDAQHLPEKDNLKGTIQDYLANRNDTFAETPVQRLERAMDAVKANKGGNFDALLVTPTKKQMEIAGRSVDCHPEGEGGATGASDAKASTSSAAPPVYKDPWDEEEDELMKAGSLSRKERIEQAMASKAAKEAGEKPGLGFGWTSSTSQAGQQGVEPARSAEGETLSSSGSAESGEARVPSPTGQATPPPPGPEMESDQEQLEAVQSVTVVGVDIAPSSSSSSSPGGSTEAQGVRLARLPPR